MTDTDLPVVPDTIEPIIAWKALNAQHGRLLSPAYGVIWPTGQRLEALCPYKNTYQWCVIPKTQPRKNAPPHIEQPNPLTDGLEETYHWSYELIEHDIVSPECSCGIYAMDQPGDTLGYLDGNCVLAEIAIWGRTIKGTRGVRGQYAYPQRIYCHASQERTMRPLAEKYGIELVVAPVEQVIREHTPPRKRTKMQHYTNATLAFSVVINTLAGTHSLSNNNYWLASLSLGVAAFAGAVLTFLWKKR